MGELEIFINTVSNHDPLLFDLAGGWKATAELKKLRELKALATVIVEQRHRFEEFDLDRSKKVILDKLQKLVEAEA